MSKKNILDKVRMYSCFWENIKGYRNIKLVDGNLVFNFDDGRNPYVQRIDNRLVNSGLVIQNFMEAAERMSSTPRENWQQVLPEWTDPNGFVEVDGVVYSPYK